MTRRYHQGNYMSVVLSVEKYTLKRFLSLYWFATERYVIM